MSFIHPISFIYETLFQMKLLKLWEGRFQAVFFSKSEQVFTSFPSTDPCTETFSARLRLWSFFEHTVVMLPDPPQPHDRDQWCEWTISSPLVSVLSPDGVWNRCKSPRTEKELTEHMCMFPSALFLFGTIWTCSRPRPGVEIDTSRQEIVRSCH